MNKHRAAVIQAEGETEEVPAINTFPTVMRMRHACLDEPTTTDATARQSARLVVKTQLCTLHLHPNISLAQSKVYVSIHNYRK
jgi:hypothetical protein